MEEMEEMEVWREWRSTFLSYPLETGVPQCIVKTQIARGSAESQRGPLSPFLLVA